MGRGHQSAVSLNNIDDKPSLHASRLDETAFCLIHVWVWPWLLLVSAFVQKYLGTIEYVWFTYFLWQAISDLSKSMLSCSKWRSKAKGGCLGTIWWGSCSGIEGWRLQRSHKVFCHLCSGEPLRTGSLQGWCKVKYNGLPELPSCTMPLHIIILGSRKPHDTRMLLDTWDACAVVMMATDLGRSTEHGFLLMPALWFWQLCAWLKAVWTDYWLVICRVWMFLWLVMMFHRKSQTHLSIR